MSRIQLALNVDDVDAAVAFYERLFGTPPAKRRPGYANFAVAEPPLKLVLIESPGKGGTLNHLGVEVFSQEEVSAAERRLADAGLAPAPEKGTTCCYALQDKVWVHDPDGAPWEVYTVLADASAGPHPVPSPARAGEAAAVCCGGSAPSEDAPGAISEAEGSACCGPLAESAAAGCGSPSAS
jgi:catechol 2,3-dioxygenase-like lactoylglutathione lyase family enzyme